MANRRWRIEGNKLIIDLGLESETQSKSGKSYMLATSNGFQYEEDIGVSFNVIKEDVMFSGLLDNLLARTLKAFEFENKDMEENKDGDKTLQE